MLLPASDSTLLIVDMQGRLMPVIHDGDAVLAANVKLAQAARLLEVPVVATEHHSKMLGVTARRWPNWCNRPSRKCTSRRRASQLRGLAAGRAQDRAGDGLRGAHLRAADRDRADRTGLSRRAGVRCGGFAQAVRPSCGAAPRAGAWRGYRHHRNGDLRVDGNLRAPALSRRVTSGQIAAPAATLSPGNAKIISLFDTIPGQTSQRRGEYFAILRAPTQEGSARSQPAGSSAFPGTRTGVPS